MGELQALFCHLLRSSNCLLQANKSLTEQPAKPELGREGEKGSLLITRQGQVLGDGAPLRDHGDPGSHHPLANLTRPSFTDGTMISHLGSTAPDTIPRGHFPRVTWCP